MEISNNLGIEAPRQRTLWSQLGTVWTGERVVHVSLEFIIPASS